MTKTSMRLLLGFVIIGLSWADTSAVRGEEPVTGQTAVLESFFRDYLLEAFRLEPLMATRLGDHRFDGERDDISSQGRKAALEHDRKALADLSRNIQKENLPRESQIDLEILRRHLERTIWLAETFRPFENDPHKLELELDAGLSATEVLAEAEHEAVRVESEMALIARQMWSTVFPDRALPLDDPDLQRAMIRQVLDVVADDHGTAASLVADVRGNVGAIKTFITDHKILRLIEPDQCRIVEMPEFLRGNSVAYLNPAPPIDIHGSSEYAISPPPRDWSPQRALSYLREYNRAMLKIFTIHEAYPGHYMQHEYSNRCPSLIRRVLSSGTFSEGWAVYTERMMLDEGFGRGDLGLRLQQLKFYLRAVVNAILDQKMHAGEMSDDEAMDLLVRRAFQTEGEAVGKIIRAKQTSCQLSTYFVGRTAFYRLRQQLQRELGDRFDLARFHAAALAHGTVPVKYLSELTRKSLGLIAQGVQKSN